MSGVNNGQAIAIRPSDNELLVAGFRCTVAVRTDGRPVKVERGAWIGAEWKPAGAVSAEVSNSEVRFLLTEPQAARIFW